MQHSQFDPAVTDDPALPHLSRAVDPLAMAARWARAFDADAVRAVRLLKHVRGKRAVLGIELETGTRVIAKMYRKDRAPRHARVLADLGAALAGATRVPRLLDCWEDMGLVLQEWVPGTPVPDYEHLAGEAALVERLAAALAALHAAPLATERRSDLAAHVRRTCGAGLDSLGAEWPQMAAMAYELEGAIYARETRMACNLRPCHGDFAPRQVFVAAQHVYLVDLDGLSLSDPAFDVASFRVGLEAHLGEIGRELADRFLAVYLASRGLDALPTLTHHEAFCDLRRALIAWRKRPPNWEGELRICLERGRARL